jgi:hypothetical protein
MSSTRARVRVTSATGTATAWPNEKPSTPTPDCSSGCVLLRARRGVAPVRPVASFAQEILSAGGVVSFIREQGDFPWV